MKQGRRVGIQGEEQGVRQGKNMQEGEKRGSEMSGGRRKGLERERGKGETERVGNRGKG